MGTVMAVIDDCEPAIGSEDVIVPLAGEGYMGRKKGGGAPRVSGFPARLAGWADECVSPLVVGRAAAANAEAKPAVHS